MSSERAYRRTFFGVSALLFAASTAATIARCAAVSAMGKAWYCGPPSSSGKEMPLPGGWAMSMAWMRMPGETWPGAAASFLGIRVARAIGAAVIGAGLCLIARAAGLG